MSDTRKQPDPPGHTSSSRTEVIDGMVHAWVTLDGAESYIGFFHDDRHAQFSIDSQIETADARWAAEAAV
jgi:hypothetical protein